MMFMFIRARYSTRGNVRMFGPVTKPGRKPRGNWQPAALFAE